MMINKFLEVIIFKADANKVSAEEVIILQDFTDFKSMSSFAAHFARRGDIKGIKRQMHSIDYF